MEVTRILAEIDAQIAKLQQARALLSSDEPAAAVRRGPGRPKGSTNAASSKQATKKSAKKATRRTLSPEARKRIADAQKKRWAASRKEKGA